MISFMVISGERSGSTWAANWLTTDTTICFHDPLLRWSFSDLDGIFPLMGRKKGVSCTALQLAPDWVNKHPARKVIVHRPDEEIAASWDNIGVVPIMARRTNERLSEIHGLHVKYKDLFDPGHARHIAEYLDVPFDHHRHAELVQMNIQPQFASLCVTERGVKGLVESIRKTLE